MDKLRIDSEDEGQDVNFEGFLAFLGIFRIFKNLKHFY